MIKWFDTPWPVHLGFSQSEKQTMRELKKMGGGDLELTGTATTAHAKAKGHASVVIVTYEKKKRLTKSQVASIITHEASHVWDIINELMGDEDPCGEHRAYGVQWITKKFLEELW